MILTLTMNPAIDKTISIEAFHIDQVNRISASRLDAAGKGINVSKIVKALGGRTKTFAFLGGNKGDFIEKSLLDEKISLIKIPVTGETRENIKVVDPINNTFTDINEKGPFIFDKDLEFFKKQLIEYTSSSSIVVLTGSVPPGVSKGVYRELIARLKSFGVRTVLDADGELFTEGLKSIPTVIKPNIHELERYVNRTLTEEEVIEVSKEFINDGIELVAVSLGADGAIFVTKDHVYKVDGLRVNVKSTVGAGDALVAGLCYGLDKNIPIEETIALAIATSAAQVTVEGTQPPTLEVVYKLIKSVKIRKLGV